MCLYAQLYHAGCHCTTWKVTDHCRESLATDGPCSFDTSTALEDTVLHTPGCCGFHYEDKYERILERTGKEKPWAGQQCKKRRLKGEKVSRLADLRARGQLEAPGEKRKFDKIKPTTLRADAGEVPQNKRPFARDRYGRRMVNTQASYADPIYRLYRQRAS